MAPRRKPWTVALPPRVTALVSRPPVHNRGRSPLQFRPPSDRGDDFRLGEHASPPGSVSARATTTQTRVPSQDRLTTLARMDVHVPPSGVGAHAEQLGNLRPRQAIRSQLL